MSFIICLHGYASTKIRDKSACASRLKAKIAPAETLQISQCVGQPLIVAEQCAS